MSWLFSQALVAEYSAASSSAGAPSAPSNTTPTPQAFLSRDKTTDAWSRFPSGMTCEPLTESRGEDLLTWFRAVFLAKTLVPQERAPALAESEAGYGAKWHESLAKWDRNMFSWKTRQCLLFEDSTESLETLPSWGLMRAGELFQRPTPDFATNESDAGSWPTPQRVDYKGTTSGSEFGQRVHQFRVWTNGDAVTGTIYPNPDTYDALMGWPTAWTALSALATDKFQQWLRSHGVSSTDPDSTQPHTPA
jgi:hypothetical protein